MNIKKYTALAALALPLGLQAQNITFENTDGYTNLGVYDTWEDSPFRTGKLKGNVKVVANPYKLSDELAGETNMSEHVLAFQRSRFGSNTFGAKIDLATPIALSPTTQYVHVKIYKPKAGRTMLIGLGSRADRPWQSKEVVQFTTMSSKTIGTDKWYDAVFAISGASGVNVHSLVIASDLESTHDLTTDHIVYVDDIEVNSSSTPRIEYNAYPISIEKTTTLSRSDRYTSSVQLISPSDGSQSLTVSQQSDKLVFQNLLSKELLAKAGESVTPNIGFSANWMHGYVYLDRNTDGKFSYEINEDGTPAEGSDVMSYSYFSGHNSEGGSPSSGGQTIQPAAFTVPAGLKPGYYRMRFKIDWDCLDPAGNSSSGNSITSNGGVIVDTRLNVHADEVTLTRGQNAEGTNGEILDSEGNPLDNTKIPFGKDYTIQAKPGDGFKITSITIRHGYNLDGDSLVYETPQYQDEVISGYSFKDNKYTIPAKYVTGDIRITPVFSVSSSKEDEGNDYPRNFADDLAITRTDRKLNSFSVTGTTSTTAQTITVPNDSPNLVYRNLAASGVEMGAVAGETLTFTLNYTGRAMHPYLYIDYDADGQFTNTINSDGTPATGSEVATYSYYNGNNSTGTAVTVAAGDAVLLQSMPAFTLPDLPVGVYRARLKIDWNDIDPAGHWSENGNNKINDNGGYVIDFLLNVHPETGKLDILTTNGSVVGGSNSGLPPTVSYKTGLTLLPVPAADGYTAEKMVIRHGVNLDDSQYDKHGNRQWSEFETSAAAACSLPADSVNGDVRVTVDFENTGSEYLNVFDEEFNTADGTQPSEDKWVRSNWSTPTWARFNARTEAGQKHVGYIEDGKLVLRCVSNPFEAEQDNSGNKLSMISGTFWTKGKVEFTYGKIEGRLKTIGHSGNFPAFWMMPVNKAGVGWPYCGEIDIWEQIDAQTKTHHTVHTKWANTKADGSECQGQTNNPAKTGNSSAALGQYHTFGLEWKEDILIWYLDGKQVFSYAKSTDQSALDLGQWPFDQPFYIIINQSVGNGSWAAKADTSFTYETLFDWVRVYQKEGGDITGVDKAKASALDYYVTPGKIRLVSPTEVPVSIYDVQGRSIYKAAFQGNKTISVPSGVYVLNGSKVIVP